jgi:hypothetical protein
VSGGRDCSVAFSMTIPCEKLEADLRGNWASDGSEPPAMTMITFSLSDSVLLMLPKLPVFGGWHLCFFGNW